MSESRHSEIRLSLTEGTADKEYQAWLEQVDGHFHVDFAYGRRGSALKTGRKTASPLPLEEAAAALARPRRPRSLPPRATSGRRTSTAASWAGPVRWTRRWSRTDRATVWLSVGHGRIAPW